MAAVHDVVDPQALRALTHPVRIRLIETLALRGPMTATQAAAHVDATPTTCSFHLRQLARYGFVADAAAPGTRDRPWRLSQFGMRFATTAADPDTKAAAQDAEIAFRNHYLDRLRHWYTIRPDEADAWSRPAGLNQVLVYVTAEEFQELVTDVMQVLLRHGQRLVDPAARPPGARPVEFLAFAYPVDEGA